MERQLGHNKLCDHGDLLLRVSRLKTSELRHNELLFKNKEDKKMDQLVETITTKVLENVLKKITLSVGTQTEVAVRPEQAKTKTVETQTEDVEMEQEPVSNAEKSTRAVL